MVDMIGRDDWIRTSDLTHPKRARYQAAPRPVNWFKYLCNSAIVKCPAHNLMATVDSISRAKLGLLFLLQAAPEGPLTQKRGGARPLYLQPFSNQ